MLRAFERNKRITLGEPRKNRKISITKKDVSFPEEREKTINRVRKERAKSWNERQNRENYGRPLS